MNRGCWETGAVLFQEEGSNKGITTSSKKLLVAGHKNESSSSSLRGIKIDSLTLDVRFER